MITTIPAGLRRGRLVAQGKASSFGGPQDTGGKPDEGLYYYERSEQFDPPLVGMLLAHQPPGTSGLFRQLANKTAPYVAYRAPRTAAAKRYIKTHPFLLTSKAHPEGIVVWVLDWGPADWTKRAVDCSDAALDLLEVETDNGDVWLYTLEPIPSALVGALPAAASVAPTAGALPPVQAGPIDPARLASEGDEMAEIRSFSVQARNTAGELLHALAPHEGATVLETVGAVIHEAEAFEAKTGAEKKAYAIEKASPLFKRLAGGDPYTEFLIKGAAGFLIDHLVGLMNQFGIGVGRKVNAVEAPK